MADRDELCIFCKSLLTQESVVVVKNGLHTLHKCSVQRGDVENTQLFEDLIRSASSVTVHVNCRRNYTRPTTIRKDTTHTQETDKGVEIPKRRLRSSLNPFDIKKDCMFCGEEADVTKERKKEKTYRRKIHIIEMFHLQNSIGRQATTRNDEWAEIVMARVSAALDLMAAEAKYHHDCHRLFFSAGSLLKPDSAQKRPGRPENALRAEAFQKVCAHMEDADDCQFSLNELLDIMKNNGGEEAAYTPKWLKEKLLSHFGEKLSITDIPGKQVIVNFRGTAATILWDKWHSERQKSNADERIRIIRAAADIIREDICSVVCKTEAYPSVNAASDPVLPETLTTLIENVITSKGKRPEVVNRKRMAIGEALMSAARPRSYVSPILLGLGVYMHRHYASKQLLDILSSLAFSASYNEVQRYEYSAMEGSTGRPVGEGFCQYAFDNTDFNVRTLTGLGTFHCMGGVRMTTPAFHEDNGPPVLRILKTPPADVIAAAHGNMDISWYHKPPSDGLKSVTIREVKPVSVDVSKSVREALLADFLWTCGRWLQQPLPPSWNGFMRAAFNTAETVNQITGVEAVPFINLQPSNPSAIYTALLFAANECARRQQKFCFVTFDQPLYAKATEIVAAAAPGGELDKVTVRLGGFHLLMSFLGSIGFIMSGSGLEELWTEVYAKASVNHMMSGHAYSRAVRAHLLSYEALTWMILEKIEEGLLIDPLRDCYQDVYSGEKSLQEASRAAALDEFRRVFQEQLETLSRQSRTSKLWVQYMHQVDLMRLFIRAERVGDWELHLHCIREMLPYFHGAGHFHYAKFAHLYVQQMEDLEKKMPAEDYERFTKNGLFTIRRKPEQWAGVWTDMCIEQDLMRPFKSQGGLTHGRGVNEASLARFVVAFPACMKICEVVEKLTGVQAISSEQHVDLRDSRRKRDCQDVSTFKTWLKNHTPWSTEFDDLRSLSSGIVGDERTNCDCARSIGEAAMKKMVGLSFGEVKLTRKDRVKPLATVHRGVVIREDIVPVNPQQLFMRIVCVMKTEENLHEYLRFELAPTPPALFDDVSLRKTAKSVVQSFFPSDPPQELDCEGACKVVDGGYLLHVVVWPRPATYGQVIQCYVKYIQNRFGSAVTVVFDGYDISSTKTQEQRRRATKRAPAEVVFDENTSVTLTQADFLSHPMNKARLIDLLSDEFQKVGVGVKRAAADADTLIVRTALQLDESGRRTTLVASDTDILVMLIARAKDDTSIKMLIPNSSTTPGKVFTIADIRSQNKSMNDCVLFWHAVTGCDTTSALYRMGKKRAWKLLKDRPGLKTCSDIFKNPNASKEEISAAGEKFIVALYNGEEGESLDSLRVIRYTQTIAKQPVTGSFDLATLPPTSAACEQHSYRTYLQVQEWLETSKDPENWGWKSYRSVLVPIPSSRPPAPDSLLNLISCGCKTDCAVRCSCRQAGLKCGIVCSYCRGGSCTNSDFIDDEDVDNPEVLSEI